MKIELAAILIFLIPVAISCSMKIEDESKDTVLIDLESNIKNFRSLKLSEVASTIEYIPLGSSSGFFLKDILDVEINHDYILVRDMNKIGLFDKSGTFITEIGKKGNGPDEYQIAGKSYLLKDCIYVPSVIGKPNILIYDITGKFIQACSYPQHHISSIHSNWLPISQAEFLLQVPNNSGDQAFRIIRVDFQGKILNGYPNSTKFEPFNPSVFSTDSQASQFYLFDNMTRYKEVRNDTIWELSDEKLKAHYVINRGKFGSNVDFRSISVEKINDDKVRIERIFETQRFLFFETLYKKLYPFYFYMEYNIITGSNRAFPILGVYNKEVGDTYFVKPSNMDDLEFPTGIPTGLENDIDGGINFFPKQYVSDSLLLSWFEAHKLIEYAASETYKKSNPNNMDQKKEFAEMTSNLTLNDNPVLMLIKLNK